MIPRIISVEYLKGFVIRVRFSDGSQGDVDLNDDLDGPIFQPLRDPDYFKKFMLHPELHTITWPNGADFAPEFLYEKIQISAL
jgi:hypothetical protein